MNRFFFILFFSTQFSFAQAFDKLTYLKLLKANKEEFVTYAKSSGFTTELDRTSQTIFARKKGCVYGKSLGDKNNNESYDLIMFVSTLDKNNNKLILKNAKETEEKGTWIEGKYLYIEWEMQNPISNEMWYKVLIYRKK